MEEYKQTGIKLAKKLKKRHGKHMPWTNNHMFGITWELYDIFSKEVK